jgi:glycine cleavage system H protein
VTPQDRNYSEGHLWVKIEEDLTVTIGVTDHLQSQIGSIVFVDLARAGTRVRRSGRLGEIEYDPESCSIEFRLSFSDQFSQLRDADEERYLTELKCPVDGNIIEVNDRLNERPDLANVDPYGEGWLARVRLDDSVEPGDLLSGAEYESFLSEARG